MPTFRFSALPQRQRGLFLVAAAAFLWSSSGLFIKLLPQGPLTIAFWRSLVAAGAMAGFRALQGRPFPWRFGRLDTLCAVCYAAVLVCFVAATKLTTAANAIFLQFSAPIYLLFLEPLVFRTPMARRDLWAVFACLAGMALFFRDGLGGGALLGNLLGITSGIFLALVSLLIKLNRQRHPELDPAQPILLGNLVVAAACLPWAWPPAGFTSGQALSLAYLGVFQLGLAYLLFAEGLRHVTATAAMITSILEAVLNPVWVFLGTGERPSPSALAGAVVVMGVLAWYTLTHPPAEPGVS